MNFFVFVGIALYAGVAIAVQSLINSQVQRKWGLPITVLINTTVGALFATCVVLWSRFLGSMKEVPSPTSLPLSLYVGGLLGVSIVFSAAAAFPRLGATWALMFMILGQLIIGLMADHFGWFGVPRTPIGLFRIMGVALMLAGCFLARR